MSPGRLALAVVALLALAGCLTPPPPAPPPVSRAPPIAPHLSQGLPPETPPGLGAAAFPVDRLPGWETEDHVAAFGAVLAACRLKPDLGDTAACRDAQRLGSPDERAARGFLVGHFRAVPINSGGLLTAYFSPDYEARRQPEGDFTAPVRPRPASTDTAPRAVIEARPAPDALAWMRPEDLFFLQIQGSGVLSFPDGGRSRAVFAAANGQPFVAIANPMIARGVLAPAAASAGSVHDWLAAHRGPQADALMQLNPRYIYFRLQPDDGTEPAGAAGVRLIAGRSLAIDPRVYPYGELLWIDGEAPTLAGARAAYRRLAVAMDRGSAITGVVRADLYLGRGERAGDEAAHVHHSLALYRLEPLDGMRP